MKVKEMDWELISGTPETNVLVWAAIILVGGCCGWQIVCRCCCPKRACC